MRAGAVPGAHGWAAGVSLMAAPIAVSLAEEYQAELTLLHVMEKRGRNEMEMPCDSADGCAQRLRALMAEEAKMWCEPHFVVETTAATG